MAGKTSNDLLMLMAICLIVFVGLAFVKALWFFNYADDKELAKSLFHKNVLGLFTVPAEAGQLATRPWTIFTSMFVHQNNEVWKVFSNMFWLWSFGYILQDLTGGKKIIPVFVYGALGSVIVFVLAYNLLPSLQAQKACQFGSGQLRSDGCGHCDHIGVARLPALSHDWWRYSLVGHYRIVPDHEFCHHLHQRYRYADHTGSRSPHGFVICIVASPGLRLERMDESILRMDHQSV
jgi:hypothetical protein